MWDLRYLITQKSYKMKSKNLILQSINRQVYSFLFGGVKQRY